MCDDVIMCVLCVECVLVCVDVLVCADRDVCLSVFSSNEAEKKKKKTFKNVRIS